MNAIYGLTARTLPLLYICSRRLGFADIVNRLEAGEGLDYDRVLAPNHGDDES